MTKDLEMAIGAVRHFHKAQRALFASLIDSADTNPYALGTLDGLGSAILILEALRDTGRENV